MIFSIGCKCHGGWYRWFAWYPVTVHRYEDEAGYDRNVYHWLRFVECSPYAGMKGRTWWRYRPVGDNGEGV
jgi:hypothetical protein